jgi:nicotinate-nucleotide adenylyltransferase
MTRLAIEADPLFELSTIEMEREGASYTVDSLELLQRAHGDDARLFLVMASDSLAQIDTWREPERILALAEWAIGPRPTAEMPSRMFLDGRFGGEGAARIHLLSGPALEVSASAIRERVAAGRSIRYLVPRAVEELIADRHLYRSRRARS